MSTPWLTEPSSRPRKPPRPRAPTTASRALGGGREGLDRAVVLDPHLDVHVGVLLPASPPWSRPPSAADAPRPAPTGATRGSPPRRRRTRSTTRRRREGALSDASLLERVADRVTRDRGAVHARRSDHRRCRRRGRGRRPPVTSRAWRPGGTPTRESRGPPLLGADHDALGAIGAPHEVVGRGAGGGLRRDVQSRAGGQHPLAGGLDEVVQRLGGGGRVQHGSGHEVVDVGRVDQVQGSRRRLASSTAHARAALLPAEPSTPTTTALGAAAAHDRLLVFPERLSARSACGPGPRPRRGRGRALPRQAAPPCRAEALRSVEVGIALQPQAFACLLAADPGTWGLSTRVSNVTAGVARSEADRVSSHSRSPLPVETTGSVVRAAASARVSGRLSPNAWVGPRPRGERRQGDRVRCRAHLAHRDRPGLRPSAIARATACVLPSRDS